MTAQWDALKRRSGSIKQAIRDKEPFERAANEWGALVVADAQAIVAVDTGELRDSITYQVTEDQVSIIAGAPHAIHVEDGTSVAEAQPYLRPAVARNRRKLSDLTRKYVRERMKR